MSSDTEVQITKNTISNYILSLLIIILGVVSYFFLSGLILYASKVAQSNILPTNENCMPFTNESPEIPEIFTNIFTTYTSPKLS